MNVWFGGLAVALMCQRSLVRSSPRSLFPDFHSQCARFPALTSPLLFCFFQNDRLGQTPNGISAQEFKFSERGGCWERGGLICDYYSINGAQIVNFVNVVGVKIAMSYAPHLRCRTEPNFEIANFWNSMCGFLYGSHWLERIIDYGRIRSEMNGNRPANGQQHT